MLCEKCLRECIEESKAALRMDPTMQDEVRDTRQDATAKAQSEARPLNAADQSARNAGCICSRKMPYLDWSHDKDCPLYRPISAPAEASIPQPEDDVVEEMLEVYYPVSARTGKIGWKTERVAMTAALAVARKGWVPLSEVDKFLLSDLSDDFGPEVVERLHNVLTPAERTERVMVRRHDGMGRWQVLDGNTIVYECLAQIHAERYAAGLRQELEEQK
jgi:hypothetical protein